MICITLFFINIIYLLVVTANGVKLDYQKYDGNDRYEKQMETNRHMNVLKIHTFPHNDVKESYLMQDFQKGQQITCFPSLYQCTFHEFRIENDTDTSLITAAIIQSMLNSKQTAKSTIRKELYHIDETEIGDTNILGEDLKQFYLRFGFPLYRENKLQHEAEILNQPYNTGRRLKRSISTLEHDCYEQQPSVKYGFYSGTSSNRLQICKRATLINGKHVFADCENVPLSSPLLHICVCCPYVTYIDLERHDCTCVRMAP